MKEEESRVEAQACADSRPLPADHTTAFADSIPGSTQPGIWVENYRILRKIGEGGMGVVYEAEQQSPRRLVALKIIRGGPLAGERAEKLFQREIQALARLRHPGIAAIYESGKTDTGQYFFSMELVAGKTLEAFLRDQNRRDEVRARLLLFLRIAAAVNYAHQRGVIHRDLKPSNVLVADKPPATGTFTKIEDDIEVKVLDFGLARITGPDTDDLTVLTRESRLEGTLAYMSPEQIRGAPDEIDLRTDIYSLGVMLYWMIAGRLPYIVQGLPVLKAAQVICEQPPQRLFNPFAGGRKVDSDLETIVLTALEKDPVRRYQSVAALAEDIRRYLANEPIVARAPSALYHVKKMVARHRVGTAFTLALFIVLIVSSVGMILQARRIQREAQSTRRVSQFIVDIFRGNDPGQALGRTLTVREVLETGARRVTSELHDEPAVQSQLQFTIGSVFKSLSSYQEARVQLEASLAARQRLFGEGSLEAAEVYNELGDTLRIMGQYPEARKAGERAVAIRRSRLGNQNALTADAINNLALTLTESNQPEQAEKLYREAISILEQTSGPGSLEISTVLNNFTILKRRMGDLATAESLTRRALEIRRKAYPNGHPWLANSVQSLGTILAERGNNSQAEQLSREALAMREKLFGTGSSEAMKSAGELANVLANEGQIQEAARLYREKLEADRKVLGEQNPLVAVDLNNLASVLEDLDQRGEAESLYRQSMAIRTKVFGEDSPQVARVLNNLARVMADNGNTAESVRLFQKSIDIKRRTQGETHPDTAEAKISLARVYLRRGELSNAEGLLKTGVDDLARALPASPRTVRGLLARAELYQRTDRRNEAERDYQRALGILKARVPSDPAGIAAAEKKYAEFRASSRP